MDDRLPDIAVWMFHHDLGQIPAYELPSGYQMRSYREGDLQTWLRIQATDPFFVPSAETFASSMPGNTAYLTERIRFLVDPLGNDIGTITAWNTDSVSGYDIGQIHWVALMTTVRGRGLGKAMLGAVCSELRGRGYNEAFLETNTRRIPALNLYLLFGFQPYVRSQGELDGWRAMGSILKFPVHLSPLSPIKCGLDANGS